MYFTNQSIWWCRETQLLLSFVPLLITIIMLHIPTCAYSWHSTQGKCFPNTFFTFYFSHCYFAVHTSVVPCPCAHCTLHPSSIRCAYHAWIVLSLSLVSSPQYYSGRYVWSVHVVEPLEQQLERQQCPSYYLLFEWFIAHTLWLFSTTHNDHTATPLCGVIGPTNPADFSIRSTVCQDTVMIIRASFLSSHFDISRGSGKPGFAERSRASCFWNCRTWLAWRRVTYR